MSTILQELNASLAQEDLFQSWKNELQLRKQLRAAPWGSEGVRISNSEEFGFLKRALYYGNHKSLFLELLYHNRDNLAVIDCLAQAPVTLTADFLAYITDSIMLQKPPAQDLQFLVTLYRAELHADFMGLIEVLDPATCAYLMARTANNGLRELLHNRPDARAREDEKNPYGLIDSGSAPTGYPALYGNKLELMAAAASSLHSVQDLLANAPLRDESIAALLHGAELLFQAGLITDCLAVLAELVRQPGPEVFNLVLDPAAPYHKSANQLLRKVLPFYCLLVNPAEPHRYALELYRSLFPGFSPDPASLLYLDINSIVLPCLQGHRLYAHFELAQKAAKLIDYRPDDLLADALQRWDRLSGPITLPALQQVVAERLYSLPHESYTVMGVLRLGQQEGRIILDQISASQLLQDYLRFFHWLPAAPFVNQELWQQLGPLADRVTRRAGETAIRIIQELQTTDEADYAAGSTHPISWKNHQLAKHLQLSKYTGVL